MNTSSPKRRGRPRVAEHGANVTLRVEGEHLEQAAVIADGLGVRRGDVLRTAIRRGLASLLQELDAKRPR